MERYMHLPLKYQYSKKPSKDSMKSLKISMAFFSCKNGKVDSQIHREFQEALNIQNDTEKEQS